MGVVDAPAVAPPETARDMSQAESLNQSVEEMSIKVDQLEQKLNEVEQFYSNSNTKHPNTPKGGSLGKDKEKEKFPLSSFKKKQQDIASREAAAAQRMQELMRQFGTILRQLTQHQWAGPFLQPVDVVGLGLHDYYEVIEKPMDFSTIKCRMEAKDGTGYKNVREICADVRLIFKNAMKYNEERDDVHVMAKTLLDKFETKWLQLLPKVDEEEERRKEEEAEMQLDMQLAQEAAHAKMARELSFDLDEVDTHLEELRDLVLQKCRKMTTEEKKRLGSAITRLSPEDINKALEIIAQNDPTFQASGETVEVDIDAQSESTLWKLKFFVKDTLQLQMKSSPSTGGNNNGDNNQNCNNKRKRDMPESVAKTVQRKSKKPTS
ncbi:transcription factor GTE6-like [Salvia miltiorrhiza]|uniref:transcription factor GTE6-like n=1 Tax=Salvia miltiorrhiza TaxID=226208 RepID=UPI0025AC2CE8|nr:transcription factor GTE6-like [Salvia miltiorrhiza]XP_057781486.1 transcription factor GTE6-like [Salvia miltiorrhiza]XP_057781487.1 transcription factor GTE6-like [Salvia miltiorrhiza]